MTYPTVAVTVTLSQLGGAIPDGTIVTATLDKDDRYQGFLVASSVSGSTVGGSVVLNCFPNNPTTGLGTTGSVYTFSAFIAGLSQWTATAQIPNTACNLSDVAVLPVIPSLNQIDIFLATKDASNGFPGLTLFKLNLKNTLGTITSFFTTAATVARTWTMPDKDGTVAMTSDVLTDHAALTSIGTNTHAQIDTALARLATTSGTNSGTNTGDETGPRIATLTHAASLKSAIIDADEVTGNDSAAAFGLIRTTWASVKAFLKTYFDTIYQATLVSGTNIKTINSTSLLGTGDIAITSVAGNAGTATALATPRAINGVNFDGSAAITVPAAAGTLTGTALAAGVTASSLTSVGILMELSTSGDVNVSTGAVYRLNGVVIAQGSAAYRNYFFGAAGNLTATGSYNNAVGYGALAALTTGTGNNAGGYGALAALTTGSYNNAVGFGALTNLTTGSYNNAAGASVLNSLTTGSYNNAVGYGALAALTTGSYNNAVGNDLLNSLTTGAYNNAVGFGALADLGFAQTAGAFGVGINYTIAAVGTTDFTLIGAASNTVGVVFTATGVGTGTGTATPNATNYNTAIGHNTGRGIIYGSNNTIIGANVTGLAAGLSSNIIIADGAGNQRINVDASGNVSVGKLITAGLAVSTVTKTANYTTTARDGTVLGDATAGAIAFTLVPASGNSGLIQVFKKIDSSANAVTIHGNAAELIDASNTLALAAQWSSAILQVNAGGTAWNVLAVK